MPKNSEKEKSGIFYDVWGDLVDLKELFLASVIGIAITMGAYLITKWIFMLDPDLTESVATGHALFAGIGGCIVSCAVCAIFFKPKRTLYEDSDSVDIMQVLKEENVDISSELKELEHAPADVIREMQENGLGALLNLRSQTGAASQGEGKEGS